MGISTRLISSNGLSTWSRNLVLLVRPAISMRSLIPLGFRHLRRIETWSRLSAPPAAASPRITRMSTDRRRRRRQLRILRFSCHAVGLRRRRMCLLWLFIPSILFASAILFRQSRIKRSVVFFKSVPIRGFFFLVFVTSAILARGRLLGPWRKAAPAMSILSKGHTCL